MNAPTFDNLGQDLLETAPGYEVVTSHVTLPPEFALPKHTHPGEEFAYLVSGSLYYWEEGQGESLHLAGDAVRVPLGKVHSIRTAGEAVDLVVFRVHEIGRPERTLVDAG